MDSFRHSHSLGQNFLTDRNLLSAIVADAGVSPTDTVIEVGAGQGALTRPLAETGARVIAFEIDTRLGEYLRPLEAEFPNLTVVFADFMKCDLADFGVTGFKSVANLPYYITTPVLFRFLDNPGCESVTVMVQKEVAERIVAPPGGKDYGVLSVSAQLVGKPHITRNVGRQMFTPPPNVDSAVVHIDVDRARIYGSLARAEENAAKIKPDARTDRTFTNEGAESYRSDAANSAASESIMKVVRAAFAMRRKTLVNCLSSAGYDKARVCAAIARLGLDVSVRGEILSPEQFIQLAELL